MASEFDQYKLAVRHFADDYYNMFVNLMPKGPLWIWDRIIVGRIIQDVINPPPTWQDNTTASTTYQDAVLPGGSESNIFRRLLSSFAPEWANVEADAIGVLNQSDPGVATDLLEDWERVLGLPESCLAGVATTLEERQRQAHAKLYKTARTTNEQFYLDYAEALGFDITISEFPSSGVTRRMGVSRMGGSRMGGEGAYSVLEITINSGPANEDLLKCAFNKVKQAHVIIKWV